LTQIWPPLAEGKNFGSRDQGEKRRGEGTTEKGGEAWKQEPGDGTQIVAREGLLPRERVKNAGEGNACHHDRKRGRDAEMPVFRVRREKPWKEILWPVFTQARGLTKSLILRARKGKRVEKGGAKSNTRKGKTRSSEVLTRSPTISKLRCCLQCWVCVGEGWNLAEGGEKKQRDD